MAATNYTPIQLYYSTTASAAPAAGNLVNGELAINITDGKLYYKDNGGNVQVIATKGSGTIGGSNTQIQFNDGGALAGNAAMVFNKSTNVTTLTTLNLTNALGATYGGTAQSAYAQGDLLYASAVNTLSKLTIGTVNYILTSTGSVPQWVAPSSVTVQTANNLAGGAGGSVPYQSAADTTTFLAIGAANRVMTSSGSAPQWVTSLTGLTGVSSSSMTNTSLTSGRLVYSTTGGAQTDSANLTFNGTTLSMTGLSNTGFSTIVKTVTLGDSNFNGSAVFAPATPAKLYIGTGTVTDVTSAASATNTTGAITAFGITPIAATNTSVTYTNASTLYIAGAPTAGTNITITNPYAFYVAGGASYFGGAVDFAVTPSYSGGTANGVMYLNASKQITTGSALTFNGTSLGVGSSSYGDAGTITASIGVAGTTAGGLQLWASSAQEHYIQWGDSTSGSATYAGAISYSHASDFMRFWVNSSEAMRLNATGLGVGTNSFTAKLTVKAAANTYTGGALALVGAVSGTSYLTCVGGSLFVSNDGSTDQLVLTSAGNFGVGNGVQSNINYQFGSSLVDGFGTIPDCTIGKRLGVAASSSSPVLSLGYYSSAYGMDLWVGTTGLSPGYIDIRNNEALIFRTNTYSGTARETMRISSGGNLTVGATASYGRIGAVQAGKATIAGLDTTSYAAGVGATLDLGGNYRASNDYSTFVRIAAEKANATNGDYGYDMGFYVTTNNGATFGTKAMTITSTGLILLGGSTSQGSGSRLQVNGSMQMFGSQGANGLLSQISSYNTNSSGFEVAKMEFYTGANIYEGQILFSTKDSGGTMAERARIDSSGNLLVGTAVATYNAAGRGVIEVNGGSTAIMALKINGGQGGYTYHDGSVMSIGNVLNGPMAFFTNNSEKARFTSDGKLLVGTTGNSGSTIRVINASNNWSFQANDIYRVFNSYQSYGSTSTTRTCTVDFQSQGNNWSGHVVEVIFAGANDVSSAVISGKATYVVTSLTSLAVGEIQDIGTGVSFSASASGATLTITATTTTAGNWAGWTVRVTSTNNFSAPTSISIA